MITLSIVAGLAVALAAFLLGLYLGERGRRHDLARITGYAAEQQPGPATVRESPDAATEAVTLMTLEQKQQLVQDIMLEARCSPEVAAAEADRILGSLNRAGAEEWIG